MPRAVEIDALHGTAPAYAGVQRVLLRDGRRIGLRRIGHADRDLEQRFVQTLSAQSRYYRFLCAINELSGPLLDTLTRDEDEVHTGLFAVLEGPSSNSTEIVGDAHLIEDGDSAEFAIAITDAWQGRGIGRFLLRSVIALARERGVRTLNGEVLHENRRMLAMARDAGFRARSVPADPRVSEIYLDL